MVDAVEAFAAANNTPEVQFQLAAGSAGIEAATNIVVKQAMHDMLFWVYGAVILLTAKDDLETRSRGMALGVSEYLTKPVSKRELLGRIETQLHAREINRQLGETVKAVTEPDKSKDSSTK